MPHTTHFITSFSPIQHNHLEVWRVESHHAQETRNETSGWQSVHPTSEDEEHLLPVDGLDVVVHERNTDGSTQFDGETTSWRHLGELVTESTDDVVAVEPETKTKHETTDNNHPHRSVVLGGNFTEAVGLEDSGDWAERVGNIVGTVSDGHENGRGDLTIREQMLRAQIITVGTGVDGAELSRIVGDNIDADTTKHSVFEVVELLLWVGPRQLLDRNNPAVVWVDVASLGSKCADFRGKSSFLIVDLQVWALRGHLLVCGRDLMVRLDLVVVVGTTLSTSMNLAIVVGVVVLNPLLTLAWEDEGNVVVVEEWSVENVPWSKTCVPADELALEEWNEEDVADNQSTEEDTENDANGGTSS